MSSNVSAAPLRFELQTSRQRRHWRWLTHFVVFLTLSMLQSPWLIATVAAWLMLSLYRSRHGPRITLLCQSGGQWTLDEDGSVQTASLAEVPFVQPWLVILPLRVANHRRVRRIAVFPDSLPAQEFRRLRVLLRG